MKSNSLNLRSIRIADFSFNGGLYWALTGHSSHPFNTWAPIAPAAETCEHSQRAAHSGMDTAQISTPECLLLPPEAPVQWQPVLHHSVVPSAPWPAGSLWSPAAVRRGSWWSRSSHSPGTLSAERTRHNEPCVSHPSPLPPLLLVSLTPLLRSP